METHIKRLNDWLAKHHARLMWTQRVPHIGAVECYLIGKRLVLVMRYTDRGGWDIFVQAAPDTLDVAETLEKAAAAIKAGV